MIDSESLKVKTDETCLSSKENVNNVQLKSLADTLSSKKSIKQNRNKLKKRVSHGNIKRKNSSVLGESIQSEILNLPTDEQREDYISSLKESKKQGSTPRVPKGKKAKKAKEKLMSFKPNMECNDFRSSSVGECRDEVEDIMRDLKQVEERDPPPPIDTSLDFAFKDLRITCSTPNDSDRLASTLPPPIIAEKEKISDTKRCNSKTSKKQNIKATDSKDLPRKKNEQKVIKKTRSKEENNIHDEIKIKRITSNENRETKLAKKSISEESLEPTESCDTKNEHKKEQRNIGKKKISLENLFEATEKALSSSSSFEKNRPDQGYSMVKKNNSLAVNEINVVSSSQDPGRESKIHWSESTVSKECKKTISKYPRRLTKKEKTKLFTTRPDLDVKSRKKIDLEFLDEPAFVEDFQEPRYMCGFSSVFTKHGFNQGFTSISDTTKKRTYQVNEMISSYLSEKTSTSSPPASSTYGIGDSFVNKISNYMSKNTCNVQARST